MDAALGYPQVLPHGKRIDPDRNFPIQRVTCNQFGGRGEILTPRCYATASAKTQIGKTQSMAEEMFETR
jgi:hypothetical protein